MILAVRTDSPEAAVIVMTPEGAVAAEHSWHAHKTLARDLLKVIEDTLRQAGSDWQALSGLICFRGPGSFTGLRIGATVMNTIAHSQRVPLVGVSSEGWRQHGVARLQAGEDDRLIMPDYGAPPHITQPKK